MFFPFTVEPCGRYNRGSRQNKLYMEKNREDNNKKQKLCLYLATDSRSGSMGDWGTAACMLQSYLCRDQFTRASKVLQL